MTLHKFKLTFPLFFAFTAILLPSVSFSQTATLSPYSRYGVGDLLFNGFSHQRAMGGISVGLRQSSQLNFGNPASYSADSIVMFELGFVGEATNFSNQNASTNKTNGNIAYLSMGFPLIKNHWYLNVGMQPYSASGYKIQQELSTLIQGTESVDYKNVYEGSGGFNRFYAGTGFNITKKLSAGFNASYLFGAASRTSKVEFQESGFINTQIKNTVTLSDIMLEGGLQYSWLTKKGLQVTWGLSGYPTQKISAKRDLAWVNYIYNGNNAIAKDTALFTEKEKGEVKLPLKAGIGFSVAKKAHWLFGADVKMTKWEEYESYGINDSLKNSFNVALGGLWIPDATSVKYFGRAEYRLGLYYNSGFLELKNDRINDFGITFGAGFPLRGKPYFSHLDIAFEFGQEGTVNDNLVRERYGRIIVGLTIREDWFIKNRFD